MTPLLAADLGTRHAGVASFASDGSPLWAESLATSRSSAADMVGEYREALHRHGVTAADVGLTTLLMEWPVKYESRRACHTDIAGLMAVGDILATWGWARVVRVTPYGWKRNLPKPIHHARVAAALPPASWVRTAWASLGPDGRDAVALGRWSFASGRVGGRGIVFPEESVR